MIKMENMDDKELNNDNKFEIIDELYTRYQRHLKFIEIIKKSNIDKEQIDDWLHQIHYTFLNKIKAKL
jgi:hypothetical protein